VEESRQENVEDVIRYARELPEFPNKAIIVQRLETRNINRYQEALMNLNEILANDEAPDAAACGAAVSRQQLQALVDKIAVLEAQDQVAE
jgi:hypothetical protein